MRKYLLAAGLAAATLVPSMAFAQQSCEQQRRDPSVGAAIGALLDSVVGRDPGCAYAYGYYDSRGMWHANAVDRASAQGYYDRDGHWVAGAPNGYYDAQGRWTTASSAPSAAGYYDARGRWVPASAGGYYDVNGQWVAATAAGHYENGRWVSGPAVGRYDANGRWIPGEADGRRDANGVWVANPQAGYYDTNGRWRAGPVQGYYDAQGRWTSTSASGGRDYGHRGDMARGMWDGAPGDVRGRQVWLDQRIRQGMADGTLARTEGSRALQALNDIRRQERAQRHYRGQLTPRNQVIFQAKLDKVNAGLRWSRRG